MNGVRLWHLEGDNRHIWVTLRSASVLTSSGKATLSLIVLLR